MIEQHNDVDGNGELMLMDNEEELKVDERHLADHHLEHAPMVENNEN